MINLSQGLQKLDSVWKGASQFLTFTEENGLIYQTGSWSSACLTSEKYILEEHLPIFSRHKIEYFHVNII